MKVDKVCQCCGIGYKIRGDRAEASRFCSKVCEIKSSHMEKSCKRCGTAFKVKPSHAARLHYCSPECRTLSGSVALTCHHCGEHYTTKASHSERSKFCSKSCMTKSNSVDKVCECCGESFSVPKRRNESVRFCSLACKTEGRRKNVECEICKKLFSCPDHKDRKFCSQECFHAAPSPMGSDHYKWVGDTYTHASGYVRLSRSGLGRNVKQQHREIILAAIIEENPNHPFLIKTDDGITLSKGIHVHHIDRKRSNNALSNLLAVTPSAHLLIHRRNKKPDPWECWPSNPIAW